MDDLVCFRKQLNSTTCTLVTEENINKISECNRKNFMVGDYFVFYFKLTEENGQEMLTTCSSSLRIAIEETKDKKFISYEGDFPVFQF